jgi:hypothetical protein
LIKVCGRKPKENGPLGRRRHTWDYNVGVELQEILVEDVDRIELAQDIEKLRAVGKGVTKLRVP